MKYIKTFEMIRDFKKGDIVVYRDPWLHHISKFGVVPITNSIIYGDECEVIDVKIIKGEEFIKVKSIKNGKMVQRLVNGNGNRMPYNPGGHWMDHYYFIKSSSFNWDVLSAIAVKKNDIAKKLISENHFYNLNMKNIKGFTPLIYAAHFKNLEILKYLIESGADWNIKNGVFIGDDRDFMDYLTDEHKEYIINHYPKEYKIYIMKKDTEKYNI